MGVKPWKLIGDAERQLLLLLQLDYQVSICSLIPPATAISKTQDRADTSVWCHFQFSS